MALVKYGAGIVEMAGSIAGTVFARNRSGNYARAKTKPTNPSTARQQAIRSAIALLTVAWSETLDAAERTAWGLYAAGVAMKNRLGEVTFLTGFNHFIRSNSVRLQHSLALIEAGPTVLELPEQDETFAATISEATQLVSVAFDNANPWANEAGGHMLIYMGSPQNAQRNFFAGPYRLAGKIAGATPTPPTTPKTFACPFVATEGQRIWIQARIQRADGRLSEPFRGSCLVGA